MLSTTTLTLVAGLTTVALASDVCWRDSYAQGGGRWIYSCPPGMEKSGLLCYPKCKSGYHGVGPVCWGSCPSGWRDDGALCNNRGGWTRGADNSRCPWYDVCGLTFSRGCSNCNKYPGTSNHGCTCHMTMKVVAKKSYGRGVGKPLQCSGNEYQSGLMCYPKCRTRDNKQFDLTSGVCWEKCTAPTPVRCGGACTKNQATCNKWIGQMAAAGVGVVAGIAATIFSFGAATPAVLAANGVWAVSGGGAALSLINPMCGVDMYPHDMNVKCNGSALKRFSNIIQTECFEECEKLSSCQFAQYVTKSEACALFRTCGTAKLDGSEVFMKKPKELK